MSGTEADDAFVEHGVIVTGQWDWTYSASPTRWTRPQQGIRPRRFFIPTSPDEPRGTGFGVWKTRLKIRGKGDSLVLRFNSEEGKDFQLLGWAIPYTVEVSE